MSARVVALLAITALALAAPRRVAAQPSEAETTARKVLIALRVLAYDRTVATRAPSAEVVVLIAHAATKEGRADRERWLAGFALLPNVKVAGRRVHAHGIELDSAQELDAAIVKLRPAMVIVGGGLSRDIAAIRRITRQRDVLSFSLRVSDVRHGIATGLTETERGDQIIINLDAARAEGAKLGAGLLELARLVDEVQP